MLMYMEHNAPGPFDSLQGFFDQTTLISTKVRSEHFMDYSVIFTIIVTKIRGKIKYAACVLYPG